MQTRITEVPINVFWRHGYHYGHADGRAGRPNLLDQLDASNGDAEVIPLPARRLLPEQRA